MDGMLELDCVVFHPKTTDFTQGATSEFLRFPLTLPPESQAVRLAHKSYARCRPLTAKAASRPDFLFPSGRGGD